MDITICVMSCGELTEKDCWKSLKQCEGKVVFQTVKDVCPQIKALNQMVSQCNTEFLIPVDVDMVLDYDAWPRITNAIRKHVHNPQWHSILFPLWDTLTETKILSLKIMRSNIIKEIMFEETATPDVAHYQRLTDSGYSCIHDYLKQKPIGNHIVKGKHFCYNKYRDVYQTYKAHGFDWQSGAFLGGETLPERAKAHFHYFVHKWLKTYNKDYLWCIAGMMDGITSETINKSKNLNNKEYKFTIESGVHCFMDWYMKYGEEFQTASYLF